LRPTELVRGSRPTSADGLPSPGRHDRWLGQGVCPVRSPGRTQKCLARRRKLAPRRARSEATTGSKQKRVGTADTLESPATPAANCGPVRDAARRLCLSRTIAPTLVTHCRLHARVRRTALSRYNENERVHSEGCALAAVWSSIPRRPPTGKPARARCLAKTLR